MASKSQYVDDSQDYQPKDTIGETMRATAIAGGVGFAVSAVQNSLAKQNVGAMGVFTRTGGAIGHFGMA